MLNSCYEYNSYIKCCVLDFLFPQSTRIEYLKICGINPQTPIVAQSFDGASVMSGRFNGVQAKVKENYPYAIYTHCMAHRVNLVVLDMCKLVKVYFMI